MTFVSFAQNLEDVMLWRALKHVESGFYIDVGANDPVVDSVTQAFYERGWCGINIEPLPAHHKDLLTARPRDTNLRCAAGSRNGEVEIWECDIRGWATASADVIAQHVANGHEGIFHKVPLRTLGDICDQYALGEIHFLKIDVEGFEKSVIEGMDFSRFRPWILVIEATRPNTTEEIYQDWESCLIAAGYVFAYSDGLNRFYVAKEHAELLDSLRYPPNVFDDFIRSQQLNFELRAQQAEAKVELLSEMLAHQADVESRAQVAEARAEKAEAESRAQVAEARAEKAEAESRAQVAETRAEKAEAESRAQVAEARAEKVEAESRAQVAEARAEKAKAESSTQAGQLEALLLATRKELEDIHQSNHYHWQLAEARQQTIQAFQSSWSWRVTAPLRWLTAPFMEHHAKIVVLSSPTFFTQLIRWGMAQHRLVSAVHLVVDHVPSLRNAITRRVAREMHPPLRQMYGRDDNQKLSANHSRVQARQISPFVTEALQDAQGGSPYSLSSQKLSVDQILERIRGELKQAKGVR